MRKFLEWLIDAATGAAIIAFIACLLLRPVEPPAVAPAPELAPAPAVVEAPRPAPRVHVVAHRRPARRVAKPVPPPAPKCIVLNILPQGCR